MSIILYIFKALDFKEYTAQISLRDPNDKEKYIGSDEVWEKAAKESSVDTMKLFGENWQKSLSDAGMKSFKEFGEAWQKSLNESNASTFKQFAENWQKTLNSSGMEHMKAYGEMMKKFAETWNNMWPKLK